MSNSLASLRHKIRGAGQLGSVVRAMKAVAASSIGQYEAAVDALADYQRSVELGLSLCLRAQSAQERAAREQSASEQPASPHAARGAQDRPVGILVFGTDQGLVGRFNEVIGEFAVGALRAFPGPKMVWGVGERLCSYLEQANLTVARRFAVPNSVTAITALVSAIQVDIERYSAGKANAEVHVFHNRPQPPAHYATNRQELLPLDSTWRKHLASIPWPNAHLAETLGDPTTSLPVLVHEYLFIALYKACAESLAAENASRLDAMQRAEKNIENVSAELRRSLNRLRQSSIDEELFDVVAGFNALSGSAE